MAKVYKRHFQDGVETNEQLIRRFVKKCDKEKIIQQMKAKEAYVSPSEAKRIRKNEWKKKIAKENAKRELMLKD